MTSLGTWNLRFDNETKLTKAVQKLLKISVIRGGSIVPPPLNTPLSLRLIAMLHAVKCFDTVGWALGRVDEPLSFSAMILLIGSSDP